MQQEEKTDVVPAQDIPEGDYPEETSLTPFEGDFMDITIEVAKNLEAYEKALNTILNFIVKRCYPGDFVSHSKMSTPLEERTVSINGAAAERIARDLGIQESNRTKPEKIWDKEKQGHYQYRCEGDFTFRGRTVHAIGIASTLNPFYAKKYGGDINPADIRDDYVMRDCLHDCVKQGVKGLFGLRNIPISKLRELGFDISKVKFVNFKEDEKSSSVKSPQSTAVPNGAESIKSLGEPVPLVIQSMDPRLSKKGKPFFKVTDTEGASYMLWGNAESDKGKLLLKATAELSPVRVVIEKDDKFSTIVQVLP